MVLGGVLQKESDASFIGFSALFVPLVWYTIGNWIDRQIAGVRITGKRIGYSVAKWSLRVLGMLGLLACLFSFQGGWDGPDNFSYIPVGLWSTWYLFCSFWGEHRLRRIEFEERAVR